MKDVAFLGSVLDVAYWGTVAIEVCPVDGSRLSRIANRYCGVLYERAPYRKTRVRVGGWLSGPRVDHKEVRYSWFIERDHVDLINHLGRFRVPLLTCVPVGLCLAKSRYDREICMPKETTDSQDALEDLVDEATAASKAFRDLPLTRMQEGRQRVELEKKKEAHERARPRYERELP